VVCPGKVGPAAHRLTELCHPFVEPACFGQQDTEPDMDFGMIGPQP